MKQAKFIVAIILILTAFSACKKDEVKYGYPALPQTPVDPLVNSVSLNGGNLVGRWAFVYERDVYYHNDTLYNQDTSSYAPGEFVIQFYSNQTYKIWENGIPSDSGSVQLSNNTFSMDGSDPITYGVSSSPHRLRMHTTTNYTISNILVRDEWDGIFDPY